MSYLILPILILYGLASILLLLYGINCYLMIYYSSAGRRKVLETGMYEGPWPQVTVQPPIFNVKTVAAQVIHAVCALDYPPDILEISVIEDSNDSTMYIIDQTTRTLQHRSIDVNGIRRDNLRG